MARQRSHTATERLISIMFAWISRLFSCNDNRAAEIEAISHELLPFLGSAKSQVDQRDLMTPNKHILMYCFAYGGIDAASGQDSLLDETARLTVLLHLIKATAQNTDAQDISAMHGRCQTLLATEEGARARATGELCFRRWQDGEHTASAVLANYLASLPESPAIPDGL